MPAWNADAQSFGAYDSLNRIEEDEKESNVKLKLTSKSLRPVNELSKFLHLNTEL